MAEGKRFAYHSLDELQEAISRRKLDLPASEDLSILATPVPFGRLTVPNRLAVHPMEGCDATPDGAPGDLTMRRYRRFGAGGAGLIWCEACAVVPEGRANPRQLWLHEATAEAFKRMLETTRAAAAESMAHSPVCVLQLTHSGRYGRPGGAAAPIIAHHSAVLDPLHGLGPDYPLITDEQLQALQEAYVGAATLAAEIGFDAVDVKSCHGYLLSELLACFTRGDSRYGGSFENRTRMLRETASRIRQAVGGRIEVTSRLNVYDGIPYPYGWGVAQGEDLRPDLAEPVRLVGELGELGFGGVNVSAGNPYHYPHVNRPADWMIANWPDPPEHPLEGVARLAHLARDVQLAHPRMTVVASGLTWLRQYIPQFAAGLIERGWASIVGLGRGALAYPDFARDILRAGGMDRHKVCVSCSSCTQLMRDGQVSGCVVRDHAVYGPIFRRGRHRDADVLRDLAGRCRRCVDPMCVTRCPAGVDIPGFLGALADGDERQAYEILRASNPLPGICGAACPVEVQCESACIQDCIGDGPVPIGEIHRNLSERAIRAGWAGVVPAEPSGRSVAIVGAGPAGLAAAITLLERGHRVVVFERAQRRGGKVGSVIPPDRLAPSAAEEEISAILDGVAEDRLQWRYGSPLGLDFTLDDLCREGYDAVVLAMGLSAGAALAEDGPRPTQVIEVGAFLQQMHENPRHGVPLTVAVIGGGNAAMDAAVCAKRRRAADVYLLYRRSYDQMPAWPNQRDEALRAGVHVMPLCQPTGYACDEQGRLTGVRVVRTHLGPAGEDGRRGITEIGGTEFVLPADMVVEALGEQTEPGVADVLPGVELTEAGLIRADGETLQTTRPHVYAAGDMINGPATVVQAVADGRRAAEAIHVHLAGGGQ